MDDDPFGNIGTPSDFGIMIKRLVRSACTLVRAGHADVFNYPWPVFVAAVDELSASLKKR